MIEITATGTIADALAQIPDDGEGLIRLEPRVYEEKVFSEKRSLTIEGAPEGGSVILWRDAGRTILDDGVKRGTFRSYTAFFGGERLALRNVTIRNDAGDGRLAGQSIAAYLDSSEVVAENCVFVSDQDTLFLSPLPEEEREPGGFRGPRENSPRLMTRQCFKNCQIVGGVDFIFGGADAVFVDCDLVCRDREHEPGFDAPLDDFVNGFITAPCGHRDGLGLVFVNCVARSESSARDASVFLGRPWRPEGKAAFLNCRTSSAISHLRFSGWKRIDDDEPDATFCEYGTRSLEDGEAIDFWGKNPWVRVLDEKEGEALLDRAMKLVDELL